MRKVKELNINFYILYQFGLLILLHALCRIAFLLIHYSSFLPVDTFALLKIFWGGVRFDLAGLIYLNLLYILLITLPFQFRHKHSYQNVLSFLFIFVNSIGIAANIIDIGYYPFTKVRTTASVFAQFSNEVHLPSLFKQFLIDYWYLVVLFTSLITLLVYFSKKVKVSKPSIFNPKTYFYYSLILVPVYLFFVVYFVRGNLQAGAKSLYLNDAARYAESPKHVPLVLSTPFTIIRTAKKKSFERKSYFTNKNELQKWFNPVHTPDTLRSFQSKNVIILILESFGREYIGAVNKINPNNNFVSYTPFLDSLFQHGLLYKNAFANGRTSVEAPPAIFASVPSLTMPYSLSQYANSEIKSLAHCLKEKGYHTSFFHGADNGTMRFDAFTKLLGFDNYYGRTEYNNEDDFDGTWGMWDEEYLQYFNRTISSFTEPFITSVFTLTSHHPFSVPKRYKKVFTKGDIPIHRCIKYTDYALKRFFELAKKQDWFENTLFVITADHAAIPYYPEYKTLAGEFAIPIFFYSPGDSIANKVESTLAQQIDIMPTVLDLLSYDQPYFAFGKSLVNTPTEKNYVFLTNKNRFQVIRNNTMLVKEMGNELEWQDLSNSFKDNTINPDDSTKIPVQNFANAFEQQYYNRVIDNRLTVGKN